MHIGVAFARWISLHQHYIIDGGYIQEAYNATRIQQHHTQEQHSTMDETQTETQTTSTLLAQAADLEPIP